MLVLERLCPELLSGPSKHLQDQRDRQFLFLCCLQEVEALNTLITNSDVTVQVDNPQKHDLSETIAEIRNQYEKVAAQNRADAENWYKTKVRKGGNQGRGEGDIMRSSLLVSFPCCCLLMPAV